MIPRIAIPVPISTDIAYNDRSWPDYAAAVERSGGEAVKVPLDASTAQVREIFATCHGVCLPGSPADVEPETYGATRDPESAPADPARELVDRTLLEEAARHNKPVLAICFGVQILNVWRGGTLVQHLMPMPVNHGAGGKVAIAHTALIAADSLLGSLCDPAELTSTAEDAANHLLRLPINSSHHQAVAAPGDDLRIAARSSEDAVIEAVEAPLDAGHPQFLLGVQWHPERSFDISATSRNLFGRLIAEAAKIQPVS